MTVEATHETWRAELAARESDGVLVQLFWYRGTEVVTVVVDDSMTGDSFELVLDEHDRPLEVFHHPYAYASARGVEFQIPAKGSEVMVDG